MGVILNFKRAYETCAFNFRMTVLKHVKSGKWKQEKTVRTDL